MKTQLQTYCSRYVDLSKEEFTVFYNLLEEQYCNKKENIVEEGKVCNYYYFISKGLVRGYYIDEKGNEKISLFAIENWWFTNLESFAMSFPSKLTLQALEETTLLAISKENLEKVFVQIPKLERLFRIIAERTLIAYHKKNEFYLKLKSIKRYETMAKKMPSFLQRVPAYMVASYLDISPEYLSEIRKKNLK